ncbi:hypothetical protein IHN63_06140 [Deinococcus sp. 6YEL10]|uniref:hypothetical protein n=1 Tax=Deinococcus sp. 6YEL10 TaxID=2745870 RepID=UPI001E34B6F4|nr:hypothetical protein [Deinococcus sp. 6YEL10]MCD0160889.1 hypothetical protein [Deinococcus sp. 6YEL10]
MATKKDLAASIKAATGTDLNPDKLTAEKLEELAELAEKGDEGREAFDAKLAEYGLAPAEKAASAVPGDETPAPKPGAKTKRVRTSGDIAARNGEFTDPETRETIGKDWVDVTATRFVRDLITSGQVLDDED